jgi:hypothetical protein
MESQPNMTEITKNGAAPGAPDPELVERAQRRRYSAEYKLRIVREADACTAPGEVGALLRREGLYTLPRQPCYRRQALRPADKSPSCVA